MNWAQIEEREIKENTTKEISGKITKVVEEEWREELLRDIWKIQKRNKRGGLQRKSRVNCVVESETKQLKSRRNLLAKKKKKKKTGRYVWDAVRRGKHFILHCRRWEEWRIESRSLHRPRIEETDQVLGEFLFGGNKNNTKKRTLLKMGNERQRLIRNNQENAETW